MERKQKTIYLPEELIKKLEYEAKASFRSVNSLITEMVMNYFKKGK